MSEHRSDTPEESPYRFFIYAADRPRAELHSRINRRVDRMIADGLADEVKMLINMGVTPDMQSMQGIGYKELIPFIAGKESLEDASEKIKTGTRNYARRQLIWFRRDNRICWLDAADMEQAEKTIIKDWESQ
jgi:tRNA delta(2)-isopentenylpyrophosphate transferase